MTIVQTIAILLTVAAMASYINHQYLRFPQTIGLMIITLTVSVILVLLGFFHIVDLTSSAAFVHSIDFNEAFLHGMLALLLFAGALHINIEDLKNQIFPIAILSTVGVLLATCITGLFFWIVAGWLGTDLPLIYALLFGALVSPTDPIAVMGILRKAGAPKSLETKITGESLFNDGVGVVLFLTIFDITFSKNTLAPSGIAVFLTTEAVGGIIFGWLIGWIFYRLLKSVDAYQVEILLTLALAVGGYALAEVLHVSAPIAIVVAGLFIGNQGREFAMSDKTREHLDTFWELIDEIMNAVLFVLIGLEVIAIHVNQANGFTALAAILIVLSARFISVYLSISMMRFFRTFSKGIIEVLTWGGLRGGISIALALSLPPIPERDMILASTYVVVVFSVLVQGLTVGKVIRARCHIQ